MCVGLDVLPQSSYRISITYLAVSPVLSNFATEFVIRKFQEKKETGMDRKH
jgi:hypothetical protein